MARASSPIDLLVVYTPRTLSEHFGGSVTALEEAIEDEVAVMNQGFVHSHLPEHFRYELVGIEAVCFEERENIRLDLQWVHASPEVAALREASGADFVLMITGTSNYGGMARSIYSDSPARWPDAFAVLEAFGLDTLSAGHELGHVLGCAHNPEVLILPENPGYNHGFLSWEDEPYFMTMMSYHYFPGEVCLECRENQLNAFSSPDIWYMFAGAGETLGQTCWPTDLGGGSFQLDCPNGESTVLSDVELAAQGIPIGDAISNNRLQVQGRWDIAAAYVESPRSEGCAEDCASLGRVACTSEGGSCGGCLPGFAEALGLCHPVVPAQAGSPLVDGCSSDAGAVATSDGLPTSFLVDLGGPYALARIDLHFGTHDADGNPDWSWTPVSFMPWNPPAPPAYSWEVEASSDAVNFVSLASGTASEPSGSVFGDENGHTMMRRAWAASAESDIEVVRFVRVQLTGCGEVGCAPQVGLHEVRAYGEVVVLPERIAARTLRITDDPAIPGNDQKKRLVFISRGPPGEPGSVSIPAWGSENDPSLAGAQLQIYRVGSAPSGVATLPLPAAGWQRTGKSSKQGYRYKDKSQAHGPIRKVILKDGLLKIVGKGAGGYSLVNAPQGELAVRLLVGENKSICAAVPARAPAEALDTSSRFLGIKNTPAPATCPDPS